MTVHMIYPGERFDLEVSPETLLVDILEIANAEVISKYGYDGLGFYNAQVFVDGVLDRGWHHPVKDGAYIEQCEHIAFAPDHKTVKAAERCLIDNGIEPDEAEIVLEALGYILMNKELYPDGKNIF